MVDRDVQERLGQQLRVYYDALVREDIPDRISTLLDKFARQELDLKKDPHP